MIWAHRQLFLDAALLFAAGLFAAAPVVRFRLRAVAVPALKVFGGVMRLLGQTPGLVRMTAVIFLFNGLVMFVYMASGIHPMLPKVFAVWTGMNIGVILGFTHGGLEPAPRIGRRPDQWLPPEWLHSVCGLAVLLIELPCFWLAIALGLSMGGKVQADGRYLDALAPRVTTYATVILPLLLLSAVSEAMAIRGSTRYHEQAETRKEETDTPDRRPEG